MPGLPLQPIDRRRITMLIDNSTDVLPSDEGPVRRWGPSGSAGRPPIISSSITEDRRPSFLLDDRCW